MRTKSYHVTLTDAQRAQLHELTTQGTIRVRTYKRAQILLAADERATDTVPLDAQIAEQGGVSEMTVQRIRRRFAEDGLDAALADKPRRGRPFTFSGRERAKITALACSAPPEGQARWTLRLLADKLVDLAYVPAISYMTVQRVLKKTTSSRT